MGVVIKFEARRWPGGRIPYEINENDFPEESDNRKIIERAIQYVNEQTSFQLVQRNRQGNHVEFIAADDTCSSEHGMIGGHQTIGCAVGERFGVGRVVHEILHAIGVFHEQQREDRALFVDVHEQYIEDGKEHNFDTQEQVAYSIGPYDYSSIMHYSKDAFSNGEGDTITPVEEDVDIGQREQLSAGDIRTVNFLNPGTPTIDTKVFNGAHAIFWNDVLVVAWPGHVGANYGIRINFVGQTNPTQPRVFSKAPPALAVYKGDLVLAWSDKSDNKINLMRYDGSAWGSKWTLNMKTDPGRGPALANYKDNAGVPEALILSWCGHGNNKLNILRIIKWGERSFRDLATFPYVDDITPSLAQFGRYMLLASSRKNGRSLRILKLWFNFGWVKSDEKSLNIPVRTLNLLTIGNLTYLAYQKFRGNHIRIVSIYHGTPTSPRDDSLTIRNGIIIPVSSGRNSRYGFLAALPDNNNSLRLMVGLSYRSSASETGGRIILRVPPRSAVVKPIPASVAQCFDQKIDEILRGVTSDPTSGKTPHLFSKKGKLLETPKEAQSTETYKASL